MIDTAGSDRMVSAVEKVRERLLQATAALTSAKIAHAVAVWNAVGAWVATVDEGAVRNTQNVDILIRREDLPAVAAALEASGFLYSHAAGLDVFLDGPTGKASGGVHMVFANEKVRPTEPVANPDVVPSEWMGTFTALALPSLVQIKLTAFRRKDQVRLLDLIRMGLIDATWLARFPLELGERLQHLLDTPDE